MRATITYPGHRHWYKSRVTYKVITPFGMTHFNVLRNHDSIEWRWLDGSIWHLDYGAYTSDRYIEINGKTVFKGVFANVSRFSGVLHWHDCDTGDRALSIHYYFRWPRRRATYRNADGFLIAKYLWRCNPKWTPDEFVIKPTEDYLTPIVFADIISQFELID